MTRSGTRLRSSCTAAPPKSISGCGAQTCRGCFRSACDTRETISHGLRLIRIRFRIPDCELPDLMPSDLNRFLSYLLLQGRERAAVVFPRKQSRLRDAHGFLPLMRMLKHERWEFAHSVASIKRSLPQGCRQHTPSARPAWEQNAFSIPPSSSPEYLRFVRTEVSRIFPYGWDRNYADFVWRHVPNPSARMSCPRADMYWCGKGKDFRRQCLTGRSVPIDQPVLARYKEVMSAGKCRPLVIYDESTEVLAPFHKVLDSHLMSMPWRLVGPPTEAKISSACVYPCQTSVDLVSATDNLSLEVTEAILGSLLR